MFSGESRLTSDFRDRRNRVWHRRNERFHDVNVRQNDGCGVFVCVGVFVCFICVFFFFFFFGGVFFFFIFFFLGGGGVRYG